MKKKSAKLVTELDIFPVVGIGASAGGLSAFTKLLRALPINTGMAFILVQHLDPKHTSLLPELMQRATAMPVVEACDGMRLVRNHIYVMPPTHSLALLHGVLHLIPRPDGRGKYLPIDEFLKSLAQDRKGYAIGIILSGTASDGTLGLQAIKTAEGITFAQSEESAEFIDMPHNAIASGYVDFILPPTEIAEKLALIAQHPYLKDPLLCTQQEMPVKEKDLDKIFILMRAHSGVDFTFYKHNTILRRIKRRMALHQLEKMADYVKFLQTNTKELDTLSQDMLINVTSFFRDPETFVALKEKVFPSLMEQNLKRQSLRFWVPACSTGEEAYSIAIALFEFLGDKATGTHVQIFATDIDKHAIDKARLGIYPSSIEEAVEAERLERFFVKTTTGYQIKKAIRDVCVFAVQNVTQDPPFSRLNLICCRNLLIYLGTMLQKRVLHTFFYALQPNCFLMLGTSETIGSETEIFTLVDKKNKIYMRKTGSLSPIVNFTDTVYSAGQTAASRPYLSAPERPPLVVQQAAENVILKKYGPPGVIVDENMNILYFRGQTGPYIEPSAGGASLNLLKLARQELVLDLRTLVSQAIKENHSMRKEGVRIHDDGGCRNLNLQVLPLPKVNSGATNYLVLFESATEAIALPSPSQPETDDKGVENLRIKELEDDLIAEREYMQSVVEEQEETNEELQAANEEIQSANEELQSTNEELETTKEELQSTNEELTTIIEEHDNRNQELNIINNDLSNLLMSIDLAIVILRTDLCVRRFTPAAKKLLNLIDADIERPIDNIRPNVIIPDLEKQINQVIKTTIMKSIEVQDRDGHWYALRIHPYRTHDNHIEGVVMVFIDIDGVKNAEQLRRALQNERRLSAVLLDSNDAVTVQDFTGHILAWNRRAEKMYGYNQEEALQLDANLLLPDEMQKKMRTLFKQLQKNKRVAPCEIMRRTKDGRILKIWLTCSTLLNEADEPYAVAITEREIT